MGELFRIINFFPAEIQGNYICINYTIIFSFLCTYSLNVKMMEASNLLLEQQSTTFLG